MRWLSVASCQLSVALICAQEVHIPLNDGWQFQQVGKEQWYSAVVPGVVHTDLLRHDLIPDPYRDSNVDSVQWIENEDWIYKRAIVVTDALLKHGHLDLVFKGLDTFAEVYLNDSLLGRPENMFRTWDWDIQSHLRRGENELKVIFRSPIKEGAKLREEYGIQLPHDNDPSGVSPYIRKAAYQFGWDFCPRLVTSGIWQEVELVGWSQLKLGSVHATAISDGTFAIWPDILRSAGKAAGARCVIEVDGRVIQDESVGSVWPYRPPVTFVVEEQERWWPNGSGEHPLHRVRATLARKGVVLSTAETTFARRSIQWNTVSDSIGAAFECVVNGTPLFIKGCNMVPPHMFLPLAGDSAWLAQVRYMQQAGMNMVRVWAGGVYPPESFLHACDTAGILVWQDLMLGNLFPFSDWGWTPLGIRYEVDEQMARMAAHPSVAIFCGNNELRVAWHNWGWQQRYGLHGSDSTFVIEQNERLWTKEIGERAQEGDVFYTPTSPLSNWGSAAGLRSGDLHYWGVWHGDSTFSSFKNNVGRFVSEYGFQSYPDSALLAKYIDPKELYLGSPAMKRLQRSYKTDRPIWEAIERELGEKPTTLGGFIEASQRVQAKAYQMAIDAHMSAQPRCMGTLLWQLNDCWPGPSWSIIDYEGRPKPAYDAVRAAYAR